MRTRLAAPFSLSMAIVFAACAPVAGPPTPLPTAPSPPTASAGAERSMPGAGATIDPDWVTRPALTCGDPERRFPPEVLAGVGFAELGLDPATQVLRATIAEQPPEGSLPATGWHRVIDDPLGVTFVAAGTGDSPWVTVAVGVINGTIMATEYGQCRLQPVAPEGVTVAEWWLDPDRPPPTPESVEVSILVRETACASGKSPEGRILDPTIVVAPEAIAVAIAIVHRPGGQDCPGNPNHAMTLVLPEPLGARKLLDAGTFPRRPVADQDPRS
jgi:hypothetical protein